MKSYNKVELKGRIHNFSLEEKDTEKGTAITGTVTLQVNEAGTCVDVRFYALPKYNSGKTNRTYSVLEDMLAGNYKTVVNDADEADWLAIDANIDIDYYVGRDGAKDIDEMSRSQRVRGSFINANKSHEYSNVWKCDMLITRIEDVEEVPEKGFPHKVRMHGFIVDDYNERLMGVRFEAMDQAPMNHLLGLSVSKDNPLYTSVKGEFRMVKTLQIQEGAFGEDEKREFEKVFWVMTWMPRNTYEFGDDITVEDYNAYMTACDEYKQEKLNKSKDAGDEGDNLVF